MVTLSVLIRTYVYFLHFVYTAGSVPLHTVLLHRFTGDLRLLHIKLNQESVDAVDCRAQAVACIARLQSDLEKTTDELEAYKGKLKESQICVISRDAALKDIKTECTVQYKYIGNYTFLTNCKVTE